MQELAYWIWLSRIEDINRKALFKLLEKYKTPENLWNMHVGVADHSYPGTCGQVPLQYKNIIDKITDMKYRQQLDKYIEYMDKNNIEIITIYDKEYPDKLKEIYDPPISLYVKGDKTIFSNPSISIIGCRKCSKYGENTAEKFAYDLASNNINIISGLARGIDTYAHMGALAAKGKTAAVVGSGLDRVYPPENKAVFEKIIETGGAVISEYVIGTKPAARNFPERNRIISGISNGVVVVEAKEKSGTLITVNFALEQGRDVYAVPGNIDNPNSCGTNRLIKEGARLITEPGEILEDLM